MTTLAVIQVILELRHLSLFSYLTDDELVKLSHSCRVEDWGAGRVFLRQGEVPEFLPIIIEGEASLYQLLPSRKHLKVHYVKPGRSVDLRAVLMGTPWHYHAKMQIPGKILWVPIQPLKMLLESHAEEYRYLYLMTTEPSLQAFTRHFKYSADIEAKDLKEFILSFQSSTFQSGQVLIEQDAALENLYLLAEGRVLHRQLPGSAESPTVTLRELRSPALVGAVGVAKGQSVSLSRFEALNEVTAWAIPLKSYQRFLRKYPFLASVLDQSRTDLDAPESVDSRALESTAGPDVPGLSGIPAKLAEPENAGEKPFEIGKTKQKKSRYKVVKQRDEMDCSAACMATISRYFGVDIGIRFFRNSIDVGIEGASLYGVARAAERVGFLTRGVQLEFEHLKKVHLPAITSIGYHFVVIFEADDDTVTLGDPALGVRVLKRDVFCEDWSQIVLLFNTTPEFFKNSPEKDSYRFYWRFFDRYKVYIFQLFLLSILLNILTLSGPVFTQVILDKVALGRQFDLLWTLGLGSAGCLLFSIMAEGIRSYLMNFVSLKIDVEFSSQFLRHLLRLPMSFLSVRRTGDIMMRLNDIEEIKNFVTSKGMETLLDTVMLVFYTFAIFYYSTTIGFVFLGSVTLFCLVVYLFSPKLMSEYAESVGHSGSAQTLLIEAIKNVGVFKAFGAETAARWRWETKFAEAGKHQFKMGNLSNVMGLFIELISRGVPLFIVLFGAQKVMQGQMTVGQIIALSSLFSMALSPALNLSDVFLDLQHVVFGLNRLNDIFSTDPEDKLQTYLPLSAKNIKGNIRFDDVSFRYGNDESPLVLQNLSLEIYPGQRVAFVGRSGSGKSTLAQLVNRLFDPTSGRVMLDGHDMRYFPLSELRRAVGVVPQDPKLTSGTILDNIALGDPMPDMKRAAKAAQLAQAESFILEAPQGYFQPLTEDGGGLSGGQRQRIAIARALYQNPRILIFDEATSGLDAENEAAIDEMMPEICQGRTVITIAHRLNTIIKSDQIFVVDSGALVENGTHKELIKMGGLYAELFASSVS